MKIEQIMARAEKELATATRNLDMAKRRGAPEQDVRNLEAKVEYRKAVLEILKDKPLELFEKVEQLEKKNDDLLESAEAAEARAEKAEKIASDLCDDFTDFVTSGIHNAAQYCANRRPECVDGRGWCNVDMKTCLGFYPEAAKKED